jgi:DNA-binding response OmpR family regulator
MRILLIEDDKTVSGFIRKAMKESGHQCDACADGEEGRSLAIRGQYDLVILDLMLPRRDGLEIPKAVRAAGILSPVLILSARGLVDDKVRGLELGADDYLSKPFSIDELKARVGALLRRLASSKSHSLEAGNLKVNLLNRKVFRDGEPVELTGREFLLLEYFMRNIGRILPRTSIAEHVWEYDFDWTSNVVDVFVSHLRLKLETDSEWKLIHTIRGVGYRFEPMRGK